MRKKHQRPDTKPPIARERDSAIVCGSSHGNGRCRKLLVANGPVLVCGNGHATELADVERLMISSENLTGLLQYAIPERETRRLIIARLTGPAFMTPPLASDAYEICVHTNLLFLAIRWADDLEPALAEILRQKALRLICGRSSLVSRVIKSLQLPDEWALRENLLMHLAQVNWRRMEPMDYWHLASGALPLAEKMASPILPFLRHNLKEAASFQTRHLNEHWRSRLFFEVDSDTYEFHILTDAHHPDGYGPFRIAFTFEARSACRSITWSVAQNYEKTVRDELKDRRYYSEADRTDEEIGFCFRDGNRIEVHGTFKESPEGVLNLARELQQLLVLRPESFIGKRPSASVA